MKILILGASYGSLLSTKLLMAGHDVTLVCTAVSSKQMLHSELRCTSSGVAGSRCSAMAARSAVYLP